MYSAQFKSDVAIKAEASEVEIRSKRVKADYYRRQLTKGYRVDESFYVLCYRLTDDEILESHAQHSAEKADRAEHESLMGIYKQRQK